MRNAAGSESTNRAIGIESAGRNPQSAMDMIIRILGLGNVLMGDDGFGPYVSRVLERYPQG